MDRVSTAGLYNSVLANLMTAQTNQVSASDQVSTGKIATDLQGYGSSASTLTAMQSVQTQISSFVDQANIVSTKLTTQDTALTQVADAGTSISQAVSNALSTNNGATLMQALGTAFQSAIEGLNTTFNGEYLFSGGLSNTQPVTATSLSDLNGTGAPASLFQNGQYVTTTQIDQSTTIQTGFLASDVGTPLFTALQSIEAYDQGPNGPFGATLTAAQSSFLQTTLTSLTPINTALTNVAAQNGTLQSQVTSIQTGLTDRQTTMTTLIGDSTNANMAQASVNLQQAQQAVQASAQVFSSLKASSLVNLLPTG